MGEGLLLPVPTPIAPTRHHNPYCRRGFICCTVIILVALQFLYLSYNLTWVHTSPVPIHVDQTLGHCRALNFVPGPPPDFHRRSRSDRHVPGAPATLIFNARIWTGGHNGTEVLEGHVYFDKGIVKGVGGLDVTALRQLHAQDNLDIVDAKGAWVTPSIVDAHSHLGVHSAPALSGAKDSNSYNGPILPWLRSLDALNTHDESYSLSIAGGVTTALVLPGSANAIGGQAFTIKLRKTAERSPDAMLLEPPYQYKDLYSTSGTVPWRQIKHACGENPSRVYGGTRMDTFWALRQAYDRARQIKEAQDEYCKRAMSGQWSDLGEFPEDFQLEVLVDVLRGRVRVQTHCYEAVDLDDLIRLSNEFNFSIAAVHHAHEAYLVPDILKRAYGSTPAAAIFATHARYKREAYRGSQFAPRILAQSGIKVVLKSDHPVSNSRHLLFDAQQAHYYGLPESLALGAVTTQPAQVIGLDHRIGYIKEGWDADLVLWDSHPLALGATPTQVYIDGVAQFELPYIVNKPSSLQSVPKVPNFDREAAAAIEYEGLPPLLPNDSESQGDVLFKNVKSVFLQETNDSIQDAFATRNIDSGVVVHIGSHGRVRIIDLQGGSISPALVSYGSALGLSEIQGEVSTADGNTFDPLAVRASPATTEHILVRAVDGLQFGGRDALLAYRAGVTRAITAPSHTGFLSGLGVEFSLGAAHKLEHGAVHRNITGLHLSISQRIEQPSVSTQIAVLRRWLFAEHAHEERDEISAHLTDVIQGRFPLVVEAHSADVIATLIELKREFEARTGRALQLTIAGATEAHLLAPELAAADVGVVLTCPRPFPGTWERRRILPGPPLSAESAVLRLLAHNVTVGVGVDEPSSAAAARFDLGWIALESDGRISKLQAISLGSTNLRKLLSGSWTGTGRATDYVATQKGDLLSFESKVVAAISSARGIVDLF